MPGSLPYDNSTADPINRLDIKQPVRHVVTPSAEDQVSTGAGAVNDCTIGGTYTGRGRARLKVTIASSATPDTFDWELKDDDNIVLASASGVAITGASQSLSSGITVIFGATTGHTVGAIWSKVFATDAWQARADNVAEEVRGNRHQQRDAGAESVLETHGSAAQLAKLINRKANGTRTAQTVIVNGDEVGSLEFQAHNGSVYMPVGRMYLEMDGACAASSLPSAFAFETVPDGSTVMTEVLRLDSDQKATFAGDVDVTGDVDVVGNLVLSGSGSITAPIVTTSAPVDEGGCATVALVLGGANPVDTDTLTIGADVYEIVDSGVDDDVSNDTYIAVAKGVDLTATAANLVAAINADDADNAHDSCFKTDSVTPALANGTENVLAVSTMQGGVRHIVIASADAPGGNLTGADPSILLAEGLTDGLNIWNVGNVDLNTLGGHVKAQLKQLHQSITITTAMLTNNLWVAIPFTPRVWTYKFIDGNGDEHVFTAAGDEVNIKETQYLVFEFDGASAVANGDTMHLSVYE